VEEKTTFGVNPEALARLLEIALKSEVGRKNCRARQETSADASGPADEQAVYRKRKAKAE